LTNLSEMILETDSAYTKAQQARKESFMSYKDRLKYGKLHIMD